jgi:nucleotide-binding universal stress UspA family protein/hemerythrin-like domain-containing protein
MYRHLLVPIDDSALSVETVRQAVTFASSLGAKATFFHANADYGATSDGALERVLSPSDFAEHAAGTARALLAKAEAVARAAKVAHASAHVTSDRPYAAILEAAERHGCDLIFMASHGRRGIRGLVLGSQTQRVLQHATIPVLVAAVEGNAPAPEYAVPLAIIRDEHRSLAAVIHGLEFVVRETRERGTAPQFPLLRAMLHYIKAFPEAQHHPKEDEYLFRKLRQRTSELDTTLDVLERQHLEGSRLVAGMDAALDAYEAAPADGFERFAQAVKAFAALETPHMMLETKVILPAAQEYLTPEDWAELAHAFAQNGDPRFGADADEEFRQLFSQILNHAPETVVGRNGASLSTLPGAMKIDR